MRQRIAIEDVRAPSHFYGDPVYKRTSIFRLRFPLEAFHGRLPGLDLVAYMRKGVCITRKYVKPKQPKTPLQLTRQEVFKSIQRHWQTLSQELLLAWKAYALRFLGFWYSNPNSLGMSMRMSIAQRQGSLGLVLLDRAS